MPSIYILNPDFSDHNDLISPIKTGSTTPCKKYNKPNVQDEQQETPKDFTSSDKPRCVGRRKTRHLKKPCPASQPCSPQTAFLLEATSQTPSGGVQNRSDLSHSRTGGQQLQCPRPHARGAVPIPGQRVSASRNPSAQSRVHLLRRPMGRLSPSPFMV